MMAKGHSECIGGIEVFRAVFKRKKGLEHFHHLLLIRIAVTGYGLFNFFGRVFRDFQSVPHSRRDGHTLCPSEFQHTLYIFSEEGGFNRKIGGFILRDQSADRIKDQLQPLITIFDFSGLEHSQVQQGYIPAGHFHQSVTHYECTGVYSQDYFGSLFQRAVYFYKINEAVPK